MFRKMFALVPLLLLFGLFNSASLSFAEEVDKEDNVVKAKNYIENNVTELNDILSSLEKRQADLDLQEIQAVIDNYYSKNPVPKELVDDKSLTIDDVFPVEKNEKSVQQEEAVLDFEELITEAKEDLAEGDSIYEFSNENGVVTVYVSKTGEVMLLDRSAVPTLNLEKNNQVMAVAAWKTTRTERTTGIAYNAFGFKMFTIWAEGNFQYNGTSARHADADGNVQRHVWGSTLVMENRAVGAKRTVTVGSYKYPEVYTRVYFEASLGIRWAGVTMTSATVEAYVGGSQTGSVYGGTKKL